MGDTLKHRSLIGDMTASELAAENYQLLMELTQNQETISKELRALTRAIKTGITLMVKLPFSMVGIVGFGWLFMTPRHPGGAEGYIPLWVFLLLTMVFLYPFYGDGIRSLIERFPQVGGVSKGP